MNATASTLRSGPQLDTRRVAAAAVDVALLAPLAAALYVLVDGVSPAFVGLVAGWALFYFFAFESGDGQTPGKRLTGLRVLRGDGSPADMRTIAVRTALRVVDFAVGLIVMLITGQRRARVGDLAAGTVVVDARAGTRESLAPAAMVTAEPEVEAPADEAPLAEDEPEPVHEPAPYVALTESAWAHVDEPVAPDTPDEVEPEEDEAPLFEPVPRTKLSEAPVELDENDPEMWMAAQREQADSDDEAPAPDEQPLDAEPAPNGDLFIHPDEEDHDRPVF